MTIHKDERNGEIIAAVKMGTAARARDFKIFLGNSDCTDLNTWPIVKHKGRSSYEYRFSAGGQNFAWRRTRNKQLGAQRKGHRDFKLIAFGPKPPEYQEIRDPNADNEKMPLDSDSEKIEVEKDELPARPSKTYGKEYERILGIYYMDTYFESNSREAKINFFEQLPEETELWCLTAVFGLQEKISKNRKVLLMASITYGGGLRALGNYI